ncbi:uncharacterized protein FFB14_02982 [Fusarium fujikuroi]|nr:uncharacterized protein FFB14_02982 [Fusarium fujikuroi]
MKSGFSVVVVVAVAVAVAKVIGGLSFQSTPHGFCRVKESESKELTVLSPSPEATIRSLNRHALPVENLLSVSRAIWLPQSQAPPDEDDQSDGSGHGPDEAGPSDAPPSTYYDMTLEEDLPILSRPSKVKNLALAIENAGREWNIDGFQSSLIFPRRDTSHHPLFISNLPTFAYEDRRIPKSVLAPISDIGNVLSEIMAQADFLCVHSFDAEISPVPYWKRFLAQGLAVDDAGSMKSWLIRFEVSERTTSEKKLVERAHDLTPKADSRPACPDNGNTGPK